MVAVTPFPHTVSRMQMQETPMRLHLDDLVLPEVQQDLTIREPSARAWLNRLPVIIDQKCAEWNLTPLEALHGGRAGCVLKVREASTYGPGALRVLKVSLSSTRAVQEAAALRCLSLGGATPEIFNVDADTSTLLLDWVPTHTTLRSLRAPNIMELPRPEEFAQMGDLLRRLRSSNDIIGNDLELLAVPTLEEFHSSRLNAAGALREVARGTRPPTPANLGRAIATLDFLVASGVDNSRTLIHGDLNSGNVLGGESPLKAIDPRPLRGDPAYDTAVLALKSGERTAEKTARILAAITGDDVERVLCWLFIARVSRI